MNSTNIIFLGFNQTCSVILTLRVSAVSLQFLLGFSLNCYIIFLLLSGRESVDISHVFWVNNSAAEIFFSIFSLLYVIFLESTSSSVVKLIACLCATTQSARLLFLCCVCLERYLAVVHPVTFLRFKPHRYRVGCSVLIWICSLTLSNITTTLPLSTYKLWLVVFLIILAVELFCCVAILRRLKDPGPRDMGNKQGEMNAAKKKAFQIVFINLLTSLTQYIPLVITYSLENILPEYEFTMAEMISNMINIFFICVQPIYILYKAGKLPFINGLQFLLGFSLNCFIIFLLLSGRESVDISHVFWVNNAAAEIFFSIFSLLYVIFLESTSSSVVKLIVCLCATTQSVRLLFLCCVCLERYLAVVHPVTFLKMKPLRYRVGCSVLVWICSLLLGTATCILFVSAIKILAVVCITVLAVEFFCGVAILGKLRDPGPRDMRREQGEMNAAKKKAFNIVLINLLIVLVQNFPTGLTYSLDNFLSENDYYIALDICTVVNFTTALVQPLFILHKYGKLSFLTCSCKSL